MVLAVVLTESQKNQVSEPHLYQGQMVALTAIPIFSPEIYIGMFGVDLDVAYGSEHSIHHSLFDQCPGGSNDRQGVEIEYPPPPPPEEE